MRPKLRDRPLVQGLLITVVAALAIVRGQDLSSPPRFDGAGYSVLALSLLSGQGYREIDHPQSPRHAHFPPGYPASLALLWASTGKSAVAAHWFSTLCTTAAVPLAWLWFRKVASARVAFLYGLTLAINWTWIRNGSAIQSEPLFLLLSQVAILATLASSNRAKPVSAIGLGLIFGACILTRHVALALVGALWLDLLLKRQTRTAMIALFTAFCVISPWITWLVSVRENTQAALLAQGSLMERVVTLGIFYIQRIPDQLTGPFVEVGTVFQRRAVLAWGMNVWAVLGTSVVLFGWVSLLRRPRRRFAGLVPFATLALLLVWPFTEAGRFLIPVVPFLIVGAAEGLARLLQGSRMLRKSSAFPARQWGAIAVLAASLPYSAYCLVSDRGRAQRETHQAFDRACDWIADKAKRSGPVLSRHPGELFWRTGRKAVAIKEGDDVANVIARSGASYLLIDEERYANAPVSPLSRYVRDHPESVLKVWEADASGHSPVAIHEILQSSGASKRTLP